MKPIFFKKPEGLAAYAKIEESKTKIYSHENEALILAPEYEKKL